jgi:DNA-directed RNA polymerase sigma subunit (sigma70/sigma32)
MRTQTPAVLPRTERRIRREARSATLRERALALRQAGWTLAAIGQALGVSITRVHQMLRKAERLLRERSNEAGAAP